MKNKEVTYSTKNIIYSIISLLFGLFAINSYFTDLGFNKNNLVEFKTVLIKEPKKTKKYNDILLQIKESEYEINYSKSKNLKAKKILDVLKIGDSISIGLTKEDYNYYILNKGKRTLLSGKYIYGITLKTDEYSYISLDNMLTFYKKEGFYGLIFGAILIILDVLLFLINIPIVTIWKKMLGK